MSPHTPAEPLPRIAITPEQREILAGILQQHLPGRWVWAFGSRATKERLKSFSDLDLAVSGSKGTSGNFWELEEALDESLLPYKVDLIFLDDVGEDFRRRIEPGLILVQRGKTPPD